MQVGVPIVLPVPYAAEHVPSELRELSAQHVPPVSNPPGQKQDSALNSEAVKDTKFQLSLGQTRVVSSGSSLREFEHFPFLSQVNWSLVVPW